MRIWRVQGTKECESHASWDSCRAVTPLEPAEEWEGFWWAEGVDPWTRGSAFLIRERDVERALSGEEVDTFAPGLYGCDTPEALFAYIKYNIGGVTDQDELYVALYEGDVIDQAEDGVIFRPRELLAVWRAVDWIRAQELDAGVLWKN